MIIEQYGIRLTRLKYEDIELVRNWRNKPEIRKTMAYKKYITKAMQEKWFKSINNKFNYYFLIESNSGKIGIISCKKINLTDQYGEGGIFLWNRNDSPENISAVLASLCLINFIFFRLNISNKSYIQILKNNKKSIHYNKTLGYSLVPGQEKIKNKWYILTKEDYLKKASTLNEVAKKLSADYDLPRVYGEKSDLQLDEINKIIQPHQNTPD
ncbi:MAG: GNAT family N-acetyltransferase [Flavobacteriales bacterium]